MCAIFLRDARAQSRFCSLAELIICYFPLLLCSTLVAFFGAMDFCLRPKHCCVCMPFPASPDPRISWNRPPLQKYTAAANAATGPRSNVINSACVYLTRNANNAGAAIQPVCVAPIWMPLSEHNAGNVPTYDECFLGFLCYGCFLYKQLITLNLG